MTHWPVSGASFWYQSTGTRNWSVRHTFLVPETGARNRRQKMVNMCHQLRIWMRQTYCFRCESKNLKTFKALFPWLFDQELCPCLNCHFVCRRYAVVLLVSAMYACLLQARMSDCVGDVRCVVTGCKWMATKQDFLSCAPPRRRHHVPSGDVQLDPDQIQPVQSTRDLGVYINGSMTMRTHINNVLSSWYGFIEADTKYQAVSTSSRSQHTRHKPRIYTVDWTTAKSCSQDCQPATSNACSPSSMPPHDWSRTHQDETTSHHCFAVVTGCPSSNTLITSSAWWFIAVCMNVFHLTWWSSSSRPQLHTAELDSRRLSRGPWQTYIAHFHHLEIGRSP